MVRFPRLLSAIAVLVAVFSLGASPRRAEWARALPVAPTRPGVVSFLAFGDSGTGGAGQRRVAAGMRRVAAVEKADLALVLGDAFYPSGLSGPEDPLFVRLFSAVYTPRAFPLPFFAVLGNHEHESDPDALLGLGTKDPRWRMPARRYLFEEPLADGTTVLFVALDTTPVHEGPGAKAAVAGLAEALRSAPFARWRIVFGHHPLVSSGLHRGSAGMRAHVGPILEAEGADLYLCGHEHILEAVTLGRLTQATSGGGAGWDRARPVFWPVRDSRFRRTGGGFVHVEVRPESARVTFHDADGAPLHRMTLAPRQREVPSTRASSSPGSPAPREARGR